MEEVQFLNELHDIIKQNSREELDKIAVEKASYPYLYHLSEIRQNLVDWIPFDADAKVLERNPECGALTGRLLKNAGTVTCVARGEVQKRLIADRCAEEQKRLCLTTEEVFHQAMESGSREGALYDVILIAGDFYRYRKELPGLYEMLKEDGRLFVADANRLGLKYIAGCEEEYRGGFFTGLLGYPQEVRDAETAQDAGAASGGRCYTRKEYIRILEQAGFMRHRFYYPYPDHKFPSVIYSDEWLPAKGELTANRRNFDRDRMELFDECKVYDTLLAEGIFGEFSNSFLIEACK